MHAHHMAADRCGCSVIAPHAGAAIGTLRGRRRDGVLSSAFACRQAADRTLRPFRFMPANRAPYALRPSIGERQYLRPYKDRQGCIPAGTVRVFQVRLRPNTY